MQGCLFGAVALFVVMLLAMLVLAYRQFRVNTQAPDPSPVSWTTGRHTPFAPARPAWPTDP